MPSTYRPDAERGPTSCRASGFLGALVYLAAATSPSLSAAGSPIAFPGAEGFGAESKGGRGGRVVEVTTLDDHGPGSLREAIDAEGPRTIVFRVGGTIRLLSELRITRSHVTVAGHTAPGGGITLRDHNLVIAADEVIVRYLRVRLGNEGRSESDAIWLAEGRNIILDHVSASWSIDETLSVSQRRSANTLPLDLVTVQWSFITESLNHSLHAKGDHGFGSLIRGSKGARYSFHHNLWAHHRARMPRPGNYAGPAEDPEGPLMDFRNNVFYNWAGEYSGYNADRDARARYNFVANYYLRGPQSAPGSVAFEEKSTGAQAWFEENWMDDVEPQDPWSLVALRADIPGYRAPAPFAVAEVETQSADAAFHNVLSSAGNTCPRDSVDDRVAKSVKDRSGRLIDSQDDVGGWPDLNPGKPYPDRDRDGMSDAWERIHGLNARDPSDSSADKNGDGYTNLEEFLAQFAARQCSRQLKD